MMARSQPPPLPYLFTVFKLSYDEVYNVYYNTHLGIIPTSITPAVYTCTHIRMIKYMNKKCINTYICYPPRMSLNSITPRSRTPRFSPPRSHPSSCHPNTCIGRGSAGRIHLLYHSSVLSVRRPCEP